MARAKQKVGQFGLAIIVDMEGCAGISRFHETYDRSADFDNARRRMTAELNAAVEGAISGGTDPTRIYAVDIHWDGRSILPDDVHHDCKLLRGGRFPALRANVYRQVEAIAYLGLYAPSGSPGVLAHTQDFHVQYLKVNGELWGDAVVESLVAGMQSKRSSGAVPILAAGDQHALAAYQRFYPHIDSVQTKLAIDASSAICSHPTLVNNLIRQKMTVACQRFASNRDQFGAPLQLSRKTKVAIGFGTSEMADAVAALLPQVKRGSGHEVCRSFTTPVDGPLDVANFLIGAALIARAADDGRGGSESD